MFFILFESSFYALCGGIDYAVRQAGERIKMQEFPTPGGRLDKPGNASFKLAAFQDWQSDNGKNGSLWQTV